MSSFENLMEDARVAVRRGGAPNPEGRCVVYWMQRAQRAVDNSALNVAIEAANILGKPVVVFNGDQRMDARLSARKFNSRGYIERVKRLVRNGGAG